MQITYGDALLGFKRALAVVSGLAAFHANGIVSVSTVPPDSKLPLGRLTRSF